MEIRPRHTLVQHLRNKDVNIIVTNVCNLSCGGCSQHCGLYAPSQHFFLSPMDFQNAVAAIGPHLSAAQQARGIGVFGGEPTTHPEFADLFSVMITSPFRFLCYSNGRMGDAWYREHTRHNVQWRIDPKSPAEQGKEAGEESHFFFPTLLAAEDLMPGRSPGDYWKMAQDNCWLWRMTGCATAIQHGRFYFCEVAAAYDQLRGEDNGLPLEAGRDPRDITEEVLAQQAEKFCRRCGWCMLQLNPHAVPKSKAYMAAVGLPQQTLAGPSLVSPSNAACLSATGRDSELVQLELRIPSELS